MLNFRRATQCSKEAGLQVPAWFPWIMALFLLILVPLCIGVGTLVRDRFDESSRALAAHSGFNPEASVEVRDLQPLQMILSLPDDPEDSLLGNSSTEISLEDRFTVLHLKKITPTSTAYELMIERERDLTRFKVVGVVMEIR